MPRFFYNQDGEGFDEQTFQAREEAGQIPTPKTTAELFAEFRAQGKASNELADHFVDPAEDVPENEFNLERAQEILAQRDTLRKEVENLIREEPTLFSGLKDAVLEGGKTAGVSALEGISRLVNFVTAREAGLAKGIIMQMRGEGTVLEGLQQGVKENIGFSEVLKELDVPEGPELAKIFGISVTARGAAGLALDILLDPLTYVSFGATAPGRVAAKVGAKSILRKGTAEIGAKSVARFAGKTLLTDKELIRGVKAMRATKQGQALEHALDMFAASKLSQFTRKAGKQLGAAFIPGFGQNKQTFNFLRRVEREIARGRTEIATTFDELFSGVSKEDRLLYFDTKWNAMKEESAFREGLRKKGLKGKDFSKAAQKFGRRQMPTKDLQIIDDALFNAKDGFMVRLAREAGLPEEIMFQNYMRSIFDGVAQETKLATGKRVSFAKLRKLSATKKKEFVEKNLLRDPVKALSTVADDLLTTGKVNNAIKVVIRKYGQKFPNARAAQELGYQQFFPEGTLQLFKPKALQDTALLAATKKKPKFLPTEVAKAMEDFGKRNNFDSNLLLKGLDGFTRKFKPWVTAAWPAFHFRNAMSNRVLRFLNEGWKSFKAADDIDAVKILSNSSDLGERTIRVGNSNISLETVKNWAKKDGITETSQFWADIGGASLDKVPVGQFKARLGAFVNPLAKDNNIISLGRKIGSAVEDEAKLAAYVRALKDGFSRTEAADIAFQGLFDYSKLTQFERQFMRRLFPFYSFTRNNFELQLKTVLQNPGRQATMFKLMKDLQQEALKDLSTEELEAFNELKNTSFMRNTFALPVGQDKDGKIMWMTGFGWPQEEAIEAFSAQGAWFRLNPLIKTISQEGQLALQRSSGRTEAEGLNAIGLKNAYEAKELQFLFSDVFKDTPEQERLEAWINDPHGFFQHPMTKLLGLKVVRKPVFEKGRLVPDKDKLTFIANPRTLNALRNTFIARALTTLKQLGDPNVEDVHVLVRYLTGVSILKQDIDTSAAFEKGKIKGALTDALRQSGQGAEVRIPFAAKKAKPGVKQSVKKINQILRRK